MGFDSRECLLNRIVVRRIGRQECIVHTPVAKCQHAHQSSMAENVPLNDHVEGLWVFMNATVFHHKDGIAFWPRIHMVKCVGDELTECCSSEGTFNNLDMKYAI